MRPRHWVLLLVVTIMIATASITWGAVPTRPMTLMHPGSTAHVESMLWKQMARFSPVKDGGRSCTAFTPPQALSERAPVGLENDTQARVNFVVTRDGDVSAIVILHLSAGDERDLIGAVMGWRFRPAMCDGVPTESEADLMLQSRK